VRFIRRNAIALTALVFAMTGTGIAASRYLITSTSQIKPSVLGQLRREAGTAATAASTKGPRAVIARIRNAAPYTTTPTEENVPLQGSTTWTQSADQLEQFAAELRVTAPSGECGGGAGVGLHLDGRTFAVQYPHVAEGQAASLPFTWLGEPWLFEPGVATNHTLTVAAYDQCGPGRGHYTIDSVKVDVIGVH
jgi:hypothetical protein